MFCKTTLVAVALGLVAAANPIGREPVRFPPGIQRIPLAKRGGLTNSDGTFNLTKAVNEIARVKKYASMLTILIYHLS